MSFPDGYRRIRFGSTVGTVRRIRSAIRRLELERSGLDTCVALAGCRRERALSRRKPRNGLAARCFGRIDRKESASVGGRAWPLAAGHLLAMLLVILPFGLLVALVEWQRQIQIGSSLLVIGFGIFRLVNRRHPRALVRIRPTQLGLWSFAVAIAHGAGLMLVPIYLGLCRQPTSTKPTRRLAPS